MTYKKSKTSNKQLSRKAHIDNLKTLKRWVMPLVFVLILVFGLFNTFRGKSKFATLPTVFVVSPPVTYGETSLAGVIRTDHDLDGKVNYYLVLDDSRLVVINPSNYRILDSTLNVPVTLMGNLEPIDDYNYLGKMIPTKIIRN